MAHALIRTSDQWQRVHHEGTALDPSRAELSLYWDTPPALRNGRELSDEERDLYDLCDGAPEQHGLVFDSACLLHHSLSALDRVEWLRWEESLSFVAAPSDAQSTAARDMQKPPAQIEDLGDFKPQSRVQHTLDKPGPLAIDTLDCLFIAERGARRITIIDLRERRIRRRVDLPVAGTPVDMASHGDDIYVLCEEPTALLHLTARSLPIELPLRLPERFGAPVRIAIAPDGKRFYLTQAKLLPDPSGKTKTKEQLCEELREREREEERKKAEAEKERKRQCQDSDTETDTEPSPPACSTQSDLGVAITPRHIVPEDPGQLSFVVRGATDLEFAGDGTLVVAHGAGEEFTRWYVTGSRYNLPSLRAYGYTGHGIVRTPRGDGRIGYFAPDGFRIAAPARLNYRPRGEIVTFCLDSGAFQTRWGRLFVEACVPAGTRLRAQCFSSDELPDESSLVTTPWPENAQLLQVKRPDLTPPLPPDSWLSLAPDPVDLHRQYADFHRRARRGGLPWPQPAETDPFETYEAPILAAPGRYLWIRLVLEGNTRKSPRVRCLRAEHPGHDHLQRLPRTFWRDAESRSFLYRFLTPLAGFLGELETVAVERWTLLDPRSTPEELLPWLASFLGVVLDPRWPLANRRRLVLEVASLLRSRGTPAGITRYLEILLARSYTTSSGTRELASPPVTVLENFRLRARAFAMPGASERQGDNRSVVGRGFFIGDPAQRAAEELAAGAGAAAPRKEDLPADACDQYAHRFSVLIGTALSADQRAAVEALIAEQRPAHTESELCTVEQGMRVECRLLLGITSVIGSDSGFRSIPIGPGLQLGQGAVVGHPHNSVRVDVTELPPPPRVDGVIEKLPRTRLE